MEPSDFLEWVQKYLPGVVVRVVTTLNGTDSPRTYLHQRMLTKNFSVTGKWESININGQVVAADYVAMDSSLPLKRRPTSGKASGDIPKSGMEFHLNEQQLTELDTLVALNTAPAIIIGKLFQDVPNAISGIYEKNELAFLQALSTGITLIQDDKNVGTGIRIDFGYKDDHKFVATTPFTDVASKPFDQLKKILDKAKTEGNIISKFMLDSTTLDNICNTDQAKQLYAFRIGFVGTNIPVPDLDQINTMTKARYGYVFEVVDRAIITQKNGKNTTTIPWEAGNIIGLVSDNIGQLTWATLAEQNHKVTGVQYLTADDYILVSQFRVTSPSLAEVVRSQARVVPVISAIDQIYLMDSKGTLQEG